MEAERSQMPLSARILIALTAVTVNTHFGNDRRENTLSCIIIIQRGLEEGKNTFPIEKNLTLI